MRRKILTSLGCSCKAVPASANDQQVQQSQPSQTSQNIQVLQQSTQKLNLRRILNLQIYIIHKNNRTQNLISLII